MKKIFIFPRILLSALFMIPSAWSGGFKDNGGDGAILRKSAILNAEEESRRLKEERVQKQNEEKERREQDQLNISNLFYRNQFCLHAYAGFFSLILLNKPESKSPMNSTKEMNRIISTLEVFCLDQNRPIQYSSFQIVKKQHSIDGQPLAFMNVPLTKISMWPERLAENLSGVLLNRYLFQALAVHEILSLLELEKDGVYSMSWQIYAKRFEIQNSYQKLAAIPLEGYVLQDLFPHVFKLYSHQRFLDSWNRFASKIHDWISSEQSNYLPPSQLLSGYHLDIRSLLPLFKPPSRPAATFDDLGSRSREFLVDGLWGSTTNPKLPLEQSTNYNRFPISHSDFAQPLKFVDRIEIIEKMLVPKDSEILDLEPLSCSIDLTWLQGMKFVASETRGFIVSSVFYLRDSKFPLLKTVTHISKTNYCIQNNTFDINTMRVCSDADRKNDKIVTLKPLAQFSVPSFPPDKATLSKIQNRLRPQIADLLLEKNRNSKIHSLMTVFDIQRQSAFAFLVNNPGFNISNSERWDHPTPGSFDDFCLDPPEDPLSLDVE